jgi:hypothetical protein
MKIFHENYQLQKIEMKKIILILCLFGYILNGFSQEKNRIVNNSIERRIGIDFGLGINFFSGQNDNYSKLAGDIGIIYEIKEKFLFGLDLSYSPKEQHEDTGVDGSRSTHVKWDGQAICVEAYIGHKLFNMASFFAGFGTCFSNEYEVMKGYSNLTSYKRESKTYFSPIMGVIYEFPKANVNEWYLKYDMAVGGYERYSIGAGLKF